MKVKAILNFAYLGKAYKAGDEFTATPEQYEAIKTDVYIVIPKKAVKKVKKKATKKAPKVKNKQVRKAKNK
jgi:hypothetical protein